MVHIRKYQVVELAGQQHAEYLVVVELRHVTFGVWKRFGEFQRLVRNLNRNSDLRYQYQNSLLSWEALRRRKRMFRCLDADYLTLKYVSLFHEHSLLHIQLILNPHTNIKDDIRALPLPNPLAKVSPSREIPARRAVRVPISRYSTTLSWRLVVTYGMRNKTSS